MTGKALLLAAIFFVVAMAGVGYLSTSVRQNYDAVNKVALINGTQKYFATVKYPSTGSLPHLPVKVTLSLDNGPALVTVTQPEAKDPEKFDIEWDTKKTPNGHYMVNVRAYWGDQVIGNESRQVEIVN